MLSGSRECLGGRRADVDLTTGEIIEHSAEDCNKLFLGGRGVDHWLLLKELKESVECFSPENLLILGTGSLVGTDVPGANRLHIASKNCFNEGIGSSSAGGDFAPQLRFSGYDNIVITGRAQAPVYILITNDTIEIKPAVHIWGRTVDETDTILKEELGAEDIESIRIGPAGENLVRSACIIVSDGRAAGRCGLGAVMGSKNLKAIVVKGTKSILLADKGRFVALVQGILRRFENSDSVRVLRRSGSVYSAFTPSYRLLAGRNFQAPEWKGKLSQEAFDRYIVGNAGCFSCPIKCAHSYGIDRGIYAGTYIHKLEGNSVCDFGPRLGIDTADVVIKLHRLCQQYGLDADNASGVIAWAFECYQRGIIKEADADGLRLRWGDEKVVIELLRKIAYREGFGDLLANGCRKASEEVGKESDQFCIHVKGQELYEHMRDAKGWALGVAVSERAGGHTRGAPLIEYNRNVTPEVMDKVFGFRFGTSESAYEGKAKLVVYYERLHAVLDSLGVCYFASNWIDIDLPGPGDFASLFSAATGLELSGDDLMQIGEQIHTIGKLFNTIHAGFAREDDYPPKRMMEEAITSGHYEGKSLPKDEWDRMLDEYYDLHGWDKETGWCTHRRLRALGFGEEITRRLTRLNRLPLC